MGMENGQRFFTLRKTLENLAATAVVFVFFTWVLQPFVPATRPVVVLGISAFTATCLSGVFFLALNMFRCVMQDQAERAD